LYKIKGILDEWLLGFNEDDLKINMFSSEKFNIKNAIINTRRVNEELFAMKLPIRLKAGLLGKISVKVSQIFLNISYSIAYFRLHS
jgi:hypothetical protein